MKGFEQQKFDGRRVRVDKIAIFRVELDYLRDEKSVYHN
jgi:hypothetical protein